MKNGKMIRLTSILLLLALCVFGMGLVSCTKNAPDDTAESGTKTADVTGEVTDVPAFEGTDIRIATLNGPTTIAVLNLLEDSKNGKTKNTYLYDQIYASADAFAPALLKGELDAAILPANAAATLAKNSGGKISAAAVNNLGVLYILEKGNSVQSLSDLRGKTVVTLGAGTTTQVALEYLLRRNGLEPGTDVMIEYKSEAAEVMAQLKKGLCDIAMLPQPAATVAAGAVEGLRTAISLNDEWNKVSPDAYLVTGVLVVNTAFAQKNPEAVALLLEEYRASCEKAVNDLDTTAALAVTYGIAGLSSEDAAKKAIPLCNIHYMDGEEMKTALKGYLGVLFENSPAAIGGEMPAESFYYTVK